MTPIGQQSAYQKGEQVTYCGKPATIVDNSVSGWLTIELCDGKRCTIKAGTLATGLWNVSSQIESLSATIGKKEAYQDFCIESFYDNGKNIKKTSSEIRHLLGGMDASELSHDEQDTYQGLLSKLSDFKSAKRYFSGLIQRNSHTLVNLIYRRGDLQQQQALFENHA